MKNRDLGKEFYLHIKTYSIFIERRLIELYYREVIDYLVEYSVSSIDEALNLEVIEFGDFLSNIEPEYVSYFNDLVI